MPQIPDRSIRLHFYEHVHIRANASQRIIDPSTGHQYEITQDMVEFHCPICQHIQDAPYGEGIDYQCPFCKWAYKIYGDLLVMWDPRSLGVQTPLYPPGTTPDRVLDANISDEEKVAVEYSKSTKRWREGDPEWGKKIQSHGGFPEGSDSEGE